MQARSVERQGSRSLEGNFLTVRVAPRRSPGPSVQRLLPPLVARLGPHGRKGGPMEGGAMQRMPIERQPAASGIPPDASTLDEGVFEGIIGQHPSMLAIFEVIRRVAPTDATVLISGESGTGKELVAAALHRLSGRAGGRFIPVHCGPIPEELLESEMFGHERGAFTGAIATRVGRFKLADGGTILLDEIGEMSPKLQVKLLRVLEDGRFEPVGSVLTQQVDVRIIAATNRTLDEAVAARQFREDL